MAHFHVSVFHSFLPRHIDRCRQSCHCCTPSRGRRPLQALRPWGVSSLSTCLNRKTAYLIEVLKFEQGSPYYFNMSFLSSIYCYISSGVSIRTKLCHVQAWKDQNCHCSQETLVVTRNSCSDRAVRLSKTETLEAVSPCRSCSRKSPTPSRMLSWPAVPNGG